MNLIEALDSRGIPWKKSGKQNNIWLCCPFCTDTRFRLGVDVAEGHGHCFNCEWKRRRTAITELKNKLSLGEWVVKEKVSAKRMAPIRLPEDYRLVTKGGKGDYWQVRAYRYLQKRGVTHEQIKRYKIGVTETGPYAYRIIIPVYVEGKLEGIVCRALKDSMEPKYKNSMGEKGVFGEVTGAKSVILVEGVFDALACDRAVGDLHDCRAVLGHSLTGRQLDMLDGYREYILWPDPDQAGIDGFSIIAEQLGEMGKVTMVTPYFDRVDTDPSDQGVREIGMRVKGRVEWSPQLQAKLQAWLLYRED
jgi:DNA primase